MKKTAKILITAAFAVGFGSLAHAQSASISANATVISELTITNLGNLNLGGVVVGQLKSLEAFTSNVSVSTGPELGGISQGRFRLQAQNGSNVRVTFDMPTNLSTPTGDLLPITFNAVIEDASYDYRSFNPYSPLQINSFNSEDPNETQAQFYIGGAVDARSGVTAGTYIGTITMSATYN